MAMVTVWISRAASVIGTYSNTSMAAVFVPMYVTPNSMDGSSRTTPSTRTSYVHVDGESMRSI